ncbi:PQ loop repeat-domain-containing protein [Piptocephalis cylindrospora]|uniref:PQ loop repeat-domain-containing protein n=1 Tax=Piptocephalis cylindrospora TaxID=1907219 RepID=A0A4P9Y5U5_9FUNG|nr:PQ loop repeat-domain-containing protein [Piptocephalis cylindrospora]|eukprot:RKP14367.1 PQ loop repeat-domain-containing protein [Piptocephalis cylindrospora]
MSSTIPTELGSALSTLIGWTYFLAWSASFYPQVLLNYQRKSVRGLSLDFLYLNLLGFTFYTIYNVALYSNDSVRESYRERHDGKNPSIHANDLFFGFHALILTIITISQTWIYKTERSARIPRLSLILIVLAIGYISVYTVLAMAGRIQWLDVLYLIGSIKVIISFIKYCPQMYLNFKRKSTTGWSIGNILLDFTGGTLSVAQQFLDAYLWDDWGSITGNPIKFGLGFLSVAFDLIFMTQHYILYPSESRDPDYTALEEGS